MIFFLIAVLTALLLLGMPESPVYLLSKGRNREAREALQWLRGQEYDIEGEILQGWVDVDIGSLIY